MPNKIVLTSTTESKNKVNKWIIDLPEEGLQHLLQVLQEWGVHQTTGSGAGLGGLPHDLAAAP